MRFHLEDKLAHLPSQSHNVRTLRRAPLSEISGSLGDLGTLLPLLIALTLTDSISLSTTLVFTGVANILTGMLFSVPLPVQPMKAVAAVAIARNFSREETASAGLFVASVIGFLSVTGLLGWVGRVVPIPVIKGIQVGAGLSLLLSAGSTLLQPLGWTSPAAGDNLLWAIAAFLFLLLVGPLSNVKRLPTIPYALVVTLVGVITASIILANTSSERSPHFSLSWWRPSILRISPRDFKTGMLTAGLGQLPLTALNSIIAVTHLSAELLPDLSAPTPSHLGLSVALMNALSCPFGSMPVCHGSGGLAGQYRFGARSGASVIILGVFKLVIGLVINESWLVGLLGKFPKALLGVMVIAAGVELAKVGEGLNVGARDLWERAEDEGMIQREPNEQERKDRWMVMMMTVAGLLAFKNDAVGFGVGLACHWSLTIPAWFERRTGVIALGSRDDEERMGLMGGGRG